MDLFEHYEKQPIEVSMIVDKWMGLYDHNGLDYNQCREFQGELETIGYTFDYELGSEPFNLRKL